MMAAEARLAESRLAESKRAAEEKAAEEKLAESQRAFETKAAEAKLAETKRAVETTLAEAKLAEARLAETKRAVEMTLAQARHAEVKPAVETRPQPAGQTRPALPRYEWCDTCGTVSSVKLHARDYGARNWEVHVSFPDGTDRAFLFPTDPGFSSGERVRFEAGRLTRQYPRRTATTYSPA
jgi:multidrug efflux pump subunit AcrA (membrane-fusion protein)